MCVCVCVCVCQCDVYEKVPCHWPSKPPTLVCCSGVGHRYIEIYPTNRPPPPRGGRGEGPLCVCVCVRRAWKFLVASSMHY